MRWSQLKKLLEGLFDPHADIVVHCTAFRGKQGPSIGRYWIVHAGRTVFDEPKNISSQIERGVGNDIATTITAIFRSYLDTPKDQILTRTFPEDCWGLVDILRAADRRVGSRRLLELYQKSQSPVVRSIIEARHPGITD